MRKNDEAQIINTFNKKESVNDFSVVVSYKDIQAKNYSLGAGQYFEVKIDYKDITQKEFNKKLEHFSKNLDSLFLESGESEEKIRKQLAKLKYGK